ncbi:MAG: DNA-binding protein [Deltaproteobacteria bacterium]|nr:DNA-binding protein [Deltaproteobacteria bacterium]
MKRLFLDANVLFTASCNPAGKASLVIELGAAGAWRLFSSGYAVAEARQNLQVKAPPALPVLEGILPQIQIVAAKGSASIPVGLVVKDQPIFQAAVACRATHLLTGDKKHFGEWVNKPGVTFGVIVQTVAQFLASL